MNVQANALPAHDETGRSEYGNSGNRALVVDDDGVMLALVGTMLNRLGYRTDTAESARAALPYLEATSYDLVITDLIMPYIRGNELADSIKDTDEDTAVIVMTGSDPHEIADLVEHCRADQWLHKPFGLRRLRRVLRRLPDRRSFGIVPRQTSTRALAPLSLTAISHRRGADPQVNRLVPEERS